MPGEPDSESITNRGDWYGLWLATAPAVVLRVADGGSTVIRDATDDTGAAAQFVAALLADGLNAE